MQTVSIQIPDDAESGDVLTFIVDGNKLELEIPFGSKPGDVLQLQLSTGGDEDSAADNNTEEDNDQPTTIEMTNGTSITLHHTLPSGQGDHDGTHRMAWPAGRLVAEQGFPLGITPSSNDSILELGSGLGVMGLAYAASSMSDNPTCIVLTDCAAAMPLLEYNVAQNKHTTPDKVKVKTRTLQWTEQAEKPDEETFTLILGSDLLYNIQSIPALVATIHRHLRTGSQMLLAVRWRKPDLERDFFVRTESLGMEWTLAVSSNSSCQLDWKHFGDPSREASNLYFTQTMVSIQGQPKSIGSITEKDLESMTDAEHNIYEQKYVQTYLGVMRRK